MAKPWSKNIVGYMRHQKFLALTANAIALWDEGKDHCAERLTDGLITKEALTTFRFRSPKAVALLTTSCGEKPDGTPYSPLWEKHDIGYKMHDYLEHNDSYEVVTARIERAEIRRVAEKNRQAAYRASQKLPPVEHEPDVTRNVQRDTPRTSRVKYEPVTPTTEAVSVPSVAKEQQQVGDIPRPMAPIHTSHKRHVVCGKVCLHESQFDEFVRRRSGAREVVRTWAAAVVDDWTSGAHADDEPGDAFDFWRARYADTWPASSAAAQKPQQINPGPVYQKAPRSA